MVRAAIRRRALVRRAQTIRVQQAFDLYLDHLVDCLIQCGLTDSKVALDVVFQTVTYLSEEDVLPPFPTERSPYEDTARWLISAVDINLVEFVVEKVTGQTDEFNGTEATE